MVFGSKKCQKSVTFLDPFLAPPSESVRKTWHFSRVPHFRVSKSGQKIVIFGVTKKTRFTVFLAISESKMGPKSGHFLAKIGSKSRL